MDIRPIQYYLRKAISYPDEAVTYTMHTLADLISKQKEPMNLELKRNGLLLLITEKGLNKKGYPVKVRHVNIKPKGIITAEYQLQEIIRKTKRINLFDYMAYAQLKFPNSNEYLVPVYYKAGLMEGKPTLRVHYRKHILN